MQSITIAGLGSYLPERVVTSAELEQEWNLQPGWIERVTGISERRFASHETAVSMAAIAGKRALEAAGMSVKDPDLIIAASSAPHQAIPCTAALIQHELGAPDGGSACFDVNATCLSFLFALHTAAHLLDSGAYRTILVVSSEIAGFSRNPAEPESAVLFGDAAVAAVLTKAEPGAASSLLGAKFTTYSSGANLTTILGGGTHHHPNDPTTKPEMNMFHMNGRGIFRKAAQVLNPFLDQFFSQVGWQREEVQALVPHQASRHGVELVSTRLGFREEQVINHLATRGNCIAASIPLALAEAVAQGRINRGDKVVLLGTGAGLTIGAVGLIF